MIKMTNPHGNLSKLVTTARERDRLLEQGYTIRTPKKVKEEKKAETPKPKKRK